MSGSSRRLDRAVPKSQRAILLAIVVLAPPFGGAGTCCYFGKQYRAQGLDGDWVQNGDVITVYPACVTR